ncbi:hypothetical protein F5Y19DRAFT_187153 [Xylariaceae sp. FL1651]|nr:hypothetical protein F5Y19DRAFT_187153 [Xylariaceae sp. FL1651]
MSSMSRNASTNSLMGFSVYQPAIGAPLQFFPAMGSKQLDDMIDAYVPGDASILDKRAAVSMEFFEYSMTTGDLFKFFTVYPALISTTASPAIDSGYGSGFTTSPVMSENQWVASTSKVASPSSSQKITSTSDFSNLPGMKIMTKDGQDVTNSASRGCKTKEQRDHAHLMRIIKACDACRRKKTKCDPSHKRPGTSSTSRKVTKKTSKGTRPAASPPPIAMKQASVTPDLDQFMAESSPSLDSLFTASLTATESLPMEWDQFIQYDDGPTDAVPHDYDFFLDPAGFFSPTTTASFSSLSTSPSQLPITPTDPDVNITDTTTEGPSHKPILPYLNPGELEAGSNYVDFNLYSPGSSSSFLDEELGMTKEVAASPVRSRQAGLERHRHLNSQEATNGAAIVESNSNAVNNQSTSVSPLDTLAGFVGDGLFHDALVHMSQSSGSTLLTNAVNQGVLDPLHDRFSFNELNSSYPTMNNTDSTRLDISDEVLEGVTSEGLYGRDAIQDRRLYRPPIIHSRSEVPTVVSTAVADASGLSLERQCSPDGARIRTSRDIDAIIPIPASSAVSDIAPSPIRNGLDGSGLGMTRTMSSPTLGAQTTHGRSLSFGLPVRSSPLCISSLQLTIRQVQMSETYSTTTAYTVMRGGSQAASPSPAPIMTSLGSDERLSAGGLMLQTTFNADDQTIGLPTSTTTKHSPAERNSGLVELWNAVNITEHTAPMRPSLPAAAGQMVSSSTLPPVLAIAGLGGVGLSLAWSIMLQCISIRATRSKGNDLENLWSVVLTTSVHTTMLLLPCLAIFASTKLFCLVSVNSLAIAIVYSKLGLCTPSPCVKASPSISAPSRTLSSAKQLCNNITNNIKSSYVRIQRIAQCGLTRSSKHWQILDLIPFRV